jgi:hypothetical protein
MGFGGWISQPGNKLPGYHRKSLWDKKRSKLDAAQTMKVEEYLKNIVRYNMIAK